MTTLSLCVSCEFSRAVLVYQGGPPHFFLNRSLLRLNPALIISFRRGQQHWVHFNYGDVVVSRMYRRNDNADYDRRSRTVWRQQRVIAVYRSVYSRRPQFNVILQVRRCLSNWWFSDRRWLIWLSAVTSVFNVIVFSLTDSVELIYLVSGDSRKDLSFLVGPALAHGWFDSKHVAIRLYLWELVTVH